MELKQEWLYFHVPQDNFMSFGSDLIKSFKSKIKALKVKLFNISEQYSFENLKNKENYEKFIDDLKLCKSLINEMNKISSKLNTVYCLKNESFKESPIRTRDPDRIKRTKRKAVYTEQAKGYPCLYCSCEFGNGQALGGHMSRKHPSVSLKYKKKKIIRESRADKRNILLEAKKELLRKHNIDYDQLTDELTRRSILKEIKDKYSKEYKQILKKKKNQFSSP